MSLLAEGIRSGVLPCSYSILLPALALVVLRKRERLGVLGVFALFTVISAWTRAAGISDVPAERAVVVLLALGGSGSALWVSSRAAGLVSAALLGVFAGATWFPCVGEELGALLTDARSAPLAALPLLAVYLVGVMMPLVAASAVLSYIPSVRRGADSRWAATVAGATLAAVAVLVVTGHYDTLLSTLARWSTL